ncbi:MAG: DUF4198 domain-containing protein [Thermoanaerobaculia bacterium]
MNPRRPALAAAALLAAAASSAHDFWIEPSTFRPVAGQAVRVGLRVGERFRGDGVARSAGRIERFIVRSAAGEREIPGEEGGDPAGQASIPEPGLAAIGYRSRSARADLPAEKFEQYLREEGLEKAIALRARRGESAKPSRELFSRCAKSLLAAGGSTAGKDMPLGFPFEVVSERNPYVSRAGESFPFRVLLRGEPAADVLVVAIRREAPDAPLTARSDAGGRVAFRLPAGGVWLVKAVHIEPIAAEDADWESFWASLTFELPGGGG